MDYIYNVAALKNIRKEKCKFHGWITFPPYIVLVFIRTRSSITTFNSEQNELSSS